MVETEFTSKGTGYKIRLGSGLSIQHFKRCMTYFNFSIAEWDGEGKGISDKRDKIDPPLTFPMKTWVEGPIPEPIYFEPYNYYSSSWNWPNIVVREGFAVSEASPMYGQYVGQREAARRSLRELSSSLYAVRQSAINLKSDHERLAEQVKAFQANNEAQIKGFFTDFYGGQGRTWNEAARNVPMCKTAMSWFYKIDSKDTKDAEKQIDKEVKNDQLNPVVANYLKRKFEEYFVWKEEYKVWIFETHDRLVDMIGEQEANIKLFEKWARDNVIQEKRLQLDWKEVTDMLGDVEFPRFASKIATYYEQFFWFDSTLTKQLTFPWWPCMACRMTIIYNPELQGWKYVRAFSYYWFGAIHDADLQTLRSWHNLDIKPEDLTKLMALRAGITEEDYKTKFGKELPKKVKVQEEEKKAEAKSLEKEMAGMFKGFGESMRDGWMSFGDTFLLPFGVDAYKVADSKRMRAEALAHKWFFTYWESMKKDFDMPVTE